MVPAKKLDDIYNDLYVCAQRGLTNAEMAAHVGVDTSRINAWLRDNPEFAKMVECVRKKGPVYNVEKSMIMKATGYDVRESTHTYERVGGELVKVKEVNTIKHIPPDANAFKFFLKNRGENWRDKVEVDTNQEINISFDPVAADI